MCCSAWPASFSRTITGTWEVLVDGKVNHGTFGECLASAEAAAHAGCHSSKRTGFASRRCRRNSLPAI